MLAIAAGPARAVDSEYHKVVDGVVIYLGVVPMHVVQDQPGITPMHGGVPRGSAHHHVMIALFEEQTGKRINNAEVTASVQELGLAWETKKLERMEIAGAMTYGNYFAMSANNIYRIRLEIRRPETSHAVEAQLEHVHSHKGR
jgi:hypothetical protein